jgi:predicted RNA-binding protein
MARKYWLDLFTGRTWEEFLKNGASVSGFRERRRNTVQKIEVGDYLIAYLTGLSRFIGVIEVTSASFVDHSPIWQDEDFPYRLKVRLLYKLDPKTAVPITEMRSKLSIFANMKSKKQWSGFFRGSPALFDERDGEAIVEAVRQASTTPFEREYDERKYWRHPKTYESKIGAVTIPDEEAEKENGKEESQPVTHEEIQMLLLRVGSEMGLDVWVARNDRNKEFDGALFKDVPNLRKELPRQFDDATNRTIELIDVLWLQGEAIVAAFEVEHTTAIYSGLLRMSDLVSMQPNIKINLYLVAPDERRDKVFEEINRPTFARLKPSLPQICKFIPYSELKKEIEQVGYRVKYLKPEFIDEIAEVVESEDEP